MKFDMNKSHITHARKSINSQINNAKKIMKQKEKYCVLCGNMIEETDKKVIYSNGIVHKTCNDGMLGKI